MPRIPQDVEAASERVPLLDADGEPNFGGGRTTPEEVDFRPELNKLSGARDSVAPGYRRGRAGGSASGGGGDGSSTDAAELDAIPDGLSGGSAAYLAMFVVLLGVQLAWLALSGGAQPCAAVYWSVFSRYAFIFALPVFYGIYRYSNGPNDTNDVAPNSSAAPAFASKPPAYAWRILLSKFVSGIGIFCAGLQTFDVGHLAFFVLGLVGACVGVQSQYARWVARYCKVALFVVYALTFPWVEHADPLQTSLGIQGYLPANACPEREESPGYAFRTFSFPLLSVIATSIWTREVDKRELEKKKAKEAADERERQFSATHNRKLGFTVHNRIADKNSVSKGFFSDEENKIFIANVKHVVATTLMFVTVYNWWNRAPSTGLQARSSGLQAVTLVLAGVLLRWENQFRKWAMWGAQFWLVTIVLVKYCYKSRGFRKFVIGHGFSARWMLDFLPSWVQEWAPEYSPRNLLDDIGLFYSKDTSSWSQQEGAMSDLLPEMVALVVIGALVVRTAAGIRESDIFRYVIPWRDLWHEKVTTQHTVLLKDLVEATRVGCIALLVWTGTWELSVFNLM